MSSYKLRYFNGRGLAEVIRLVFAAAGQQYEDSRIPSDDDRKTWLAEKESHTFHQVPELTVDGQQLPQSKAIERFLAKRFGLFGSNEIEAARIDVAGEQLRELTVDLYAATRDASKMPAFLEKFVAGAKLLDKFVGSNGFVAGDKLSLADLQIYYTFFLIDKDGSIINQCPNLKKISENVSNNENIKAWIAKRPETAF
jgi:glutathione S-transferase